MGIQDKIYFLEQAKNISSNPIDRIGPKVKEVLESGNFIFDAHCHIFDGGCVDEGYFILRMLENLPKDIARDIYLRLFPNQKDIVNKSIDFKISEIIYAKKESSFFSKKYDYDFLENLEKRIEDILQEDELQKVIRSKKSSKFLKRIKDIISILKKKKMSVVLDIFQKDYAINLVSQKQENIITVVLGMDLNMGWGYGNENLDIEKTQRMQNIELLELAKTQAILPFFPIDPRRAELKDEDSNLYNNFIKAFENKNLSFFGVKVYPALGYLPTDPRLDPIFKVCAEKNIPVVTHCGGEVVSTFQKDIKVNDRGNIFSVEGKSRKEKARFLNDPERWIPVLETHKNLHLNFGHFGSLGEWKSNNFEDSKRITLIIELMEKYKVYADFSFNLSKNKAIRHLSKALKRSSPNSEILENRTLFGTDFWVVLPNANLGKAQAKFITLTENKFKKIAKDNTLKFLYLD